MSEKLDATRIDAALERAAKKSVHGTRGDRSGRFMAPRAFISYSHDSPEHKSWVIKLGSDLRAIGVDIVLDQWDLAPGQDVSLFMQKGISEADHVVLVCSSAYVSKSEKGVGGAAMSVSSLQPKSCNLSILENLFRYYVEATPPGGFRSS